MRAQVTIVDIEQVRKNRRVKQNTILQRVGREG